MPGSIYRGYLQRQALYDQEQEQIAERKRKKLEESLANLNMEALTRKIKKDAQDWEQEQKDRQRLEGALSNLKLMESEGKIPVGTLDAAIAELTLPTTKKEATPWWMGTPMEKSYINKETYIAPTGGEGGLKFAPIPAGVSYSIDPTTGKPIFTPKTEKLGVGDITKAMSGLLKPSLRFEMRGTPESRIDSLMAGFPIAPQTATERAYQVGQNRLIEALGEFTPGGRISEGLSKETGEVPEEYESVLSAYGDYDEFVSDATRQLNEGSISQEAFDNAVANAKIYWKK